MTGVYKSTQLKYPLSESEYNKIDNVWNFIEKFNKKYTFLSDYRKYIIKELPESYDIKSFYLYESIASKLVWNLKSAMDHLYKITPNCFHQKYKSDDEKDAIINIFLKNNTYYRSGINKAVIVDKQHNKIVTRPTEGSSNILQKNSNNARLGQIIQNRKLYEKIMNNPHSYDYKKIKIPEFYYEFDYAYPNLNLSFYKDSDKKSKMSRIELMYYSNNCERNWFHVI